MNAFRSAFLPVILTIAMVPNAISQAIEGIFKTPIPAGYVVLYGTRGTDHPVLDSVPVQPDGRFRFTAQVYPPGFYQIGVNDSDRVDLVIDPKEKVIELAFHGTPLQSNLNVLRSKENQRMWTYKRLSREAQAALDDARTQRANASPLDTGLQRGLDRKEALMRQRMVRALDSLTALAPEGTFARAVRLDRALDLVAGEVPASIRKVFDFSDTDLLRSSSYSKAILLCLQGTPFTTEMALHRACDTLLVAAASDTACWTYTREHLLELFATYGPDDVAQYLVDEYVVGPHTLVPPGTAVLSLAAAQLRVAIGVEGPDIDLVSPGAADTLRLSESIRQHAFNVLFFYSSTCDHCHAQMPGLRQLVQDMEPSFLGVVGIALDATVEEFQTTLAEEMINWPCYTELNGWGAKSAKAYNVKATPSLIVLDTEGKIRAKPMDHMELRAFLEASH